MQHPVAAEFNFETVRMEMTSFLDLAQLIQDKELTLDPLNYPIENYVKQVKSE